MARKQERTKVLENLLAAYLIKFPYTKDHIDKYDLKAYYTYVSKEAVANGYKSKFVLCPPIRSK